MYAFQVAYGVYKNIWITDMTSESKVNVKYTYYLFVWLEMHSPFTILDGDR